jgi:hypothetical protein
VTAAQAALDAATSVDVENGYAVAGTVDIDDARALLTAVADALEPHLEVWGDSTGEPVAAGWLILDALRGVT